MLGALAGALGQIFTIPVSVIATRQQLAEKSTTFASTLKAILSEDGVTGLWRGLKPSRAFPSSATSLSQIRR